MINNNRCIIDTIEDHAIVVYIQRVSYNACSLPNECPSKQMHCLLFVWNVHNGCTTLQGVPNIPSGTPMCSQSYNNYFDVAAIVVISNVMYFNGLLGYPPRV